MVAVYNNSKARQSLATLLEQAARDGEVRIKRKDGQVCIIRPGHVGAVFPVPVSERRAEEP